MRAEQPIEMLVSERKGGAIAESFGPPRWLAVTAAVLAGTVLCFGAAGLVLAIAGIYRPLFAFGIGGLGLIGFVMLVVPALPRRETTRAASAVAAIALAAIGAVTVWNAENASQHVLINRDGGAYANAGRWIAREGTLQVRIKVGAFRGEPTLHFNDVGMFSSRNAVPQLQFMGLHLVPSLLAEAHAVGGDDGMFQLPAVLCGIALLQFFVLAWKLCRHALFALSAMLALALIVPEVAFARDTYTEIPAQIFVFGALVLLVERRGLPSWRLALGAGLLLGATQATRVDALLLLLGIPIVLVVLWLRAKSDEERRRLRRSNIALIGGLVPGLLLGFVDLTTRSRGYEALNWTNERTLFVLTVVAAVGCIVIVRLWPRLSGPVSALPWATLSSIAAVLVLLAALGAWFVRPAVAPLHQFNIAGVQRSGRYVVESVTLKFEGSMSWMSWYLGPVTLLAAIGAAACVTRAVLRGRMSYAYACLAVLVPGTVGYLWNAKAYTDHVWVTRRYLATAFPILVLLALGLAARLWRTRDRTRLALSGRALAVLIAVAAVAFPLYTLVPVSQMREQGGFLTAVHDVCREMGDRPVVVVLLGSVMASPDVREDWMPQTLRSWCGATVATAYLDLETGQTLSRLAARWTERGRRFFVIATAERPILQVAPRAHVISKSTVVNKYLLSQTFDHRPRSYEPQSLTIVLASLPAV